MSLLRKTVFGEVGNVSPFDFGNDSFFSLRQKNPAKVEALNLRRVSDDVIKTIGYKNGFLDTDDATLFLNGSEGTVERWYDQSANGADFIAAGKTFEPNLYDVNGIITHDGIPCLDLAGKTSMQTITGIKFTDHFAVYAVARAIDGHGPYILNAQYSVSSLGQLIQILNTGYRHTFFKSNGAPRTAQADHRPAGMHFIISRRESNNFSYMKSNQVQGASTEYAGGYRTLQNQVFLGSWHDGSSNANAYVSEIYFGVQDDGIDAVKETEIYNYYGFTF